MQVQLQLNNRLHCEIFCFHSKKLGGVFYTALSEKLFFHKIFNINLVSLFL